MTATVTIFYREIQKLAGGVFKCSIPPPAAC